MGGSNYDHDSSRIADANRNWQAACEIRVTTWDKSNEFIVALVAVCTAHNGATEAFKVQWSSNNVDWFDLGAAGEMAQGTATVLVDGGAIAGANLSGCASQVVEDSEEVEGDNQTGNLTTTAANCIEVQVAVDPSGGVGGRTYYFRLYNTTESAALGTAGATLTLPLPLTDAYGLADSITVQMAPAAKEISLTDGHAFADLPSTQEIFNRELVDGNSLADALTKQEAYNRIFTDGHALADALTKQEAYNRWLTDAYALADAITSVKLKVIQQLVTDSYALADSLTKQEVFYRELVDAYNLADAVTTTRSLIQLLSDAFSLADPLTLFRARSLGLVDGHALADLLSTQEAFYLLLEDSYRLTDILATERPSEVRATRRLRLWIGRKA